jgi:hypothetical protein
MYGAGAGGDASGSGPVTVNKRVRKAKCGHDPLAATADATAAEGSSASPAAGRKRRQNARIPELTDELAAHMTAILKEKLQKGFSVMSAIVFELLPDLFHIAIYPQTDVHNRREIVIQIVQEALQGNESAELRALKLFVIRYVSEYSDSVTRGEVIKVNAVFALFTEPSTDTLITEYPRDNCIIASTDGAQDLWCAVFGQVPLTLDLLKVNRNGDDIEDPVEKDGQMVRRTLLKEKRQLDNLGSAQLMVCPFDTFYDITVNPFVREKLENVGALMDRSLVDKETGDPIFGREYLFSDGTKQPVPAPAPETTQLGFRKYTVTAIAGDPDQTMQLRELGVGTFRFHLKHFLGGRNEGLKGPFLRVSYAARVGKADAYDAPLM